jgi:pyruvate/2-oxoglutarate dehydrogenase complex dihydrolipoamide acyltransferase (E2) component
MTSRYDDRDRALGALQGLTLPPMPDPTGAAPRPDLPPDDAPEPVAETPAATPQVPAPAAPVAAPPAPAPAAASEPPKQSRVSLNIKVLPDTKAIMYQAAVDLAQTHTMGEILDRLIADHLPQLVEKILDEPTAPQVRRRVPPGRALNS